MNSRSTVLGIVLALALVRSVPALACTAEEETAKKYTPWNYAVSAADGSVIPGIAYEVRRTGFHTADIHFKNFTKETAAFEFWLPGFQSPGDNPMARVASSVPVDGETLLPITLKSGSTGVNFAALKIFNFGNASKLPKPADTLCKPTGELWMPIVPLRPTVYFTPESVSCCVRKKEVVFRNLSRTPVFFDFKIAGYQSFDASTTGISSAGHNPRVALAVGQECAIPVVTDRTDALLSLARVTGFNVRTDSDSGEFLDATELDDGWFRATFLNCPNLNPNQLVCRIEDLDDARVRLRFKNISRLSVSFDYGLGGSVGMAGNMKIPAESESSVIMAWPRASAQLALARVKVTRVVYSLSSPSTRSLP